MLLSPHILAGAAIATSVSNPVLGVALAFLSHFFLDRVPHWEYSVEPLRQVRTKGIKYCMPILRRVALDILLGYAVVLLSIAVNSDRLAWDTAIFGGFFGILPDGLTFLLYLRQKKEGMITILLKTIYIMHFNMHFSKKKGPPPLRVGLSTQGVVVLLALYFLLS